MSEVLGKVVLNLVEMDIFINRVVLINEGFKVD